MHSEPDKFDDAQAMIAWLNENNIKHLPRQLDHAIKDDFNYDQQQIIWFEGLYKKSLDHAVVQEGKVNLTETGRSCCGGRSLCIDQNLRNPEKFVTNRFPGWYCSVNHFFLYVKQVNGEIYTNRDCKMNFNGSVGPIGNLKDPETLLKQSKNAEKPLIQCAKKQCMCGLCAPKSADLDTYKLIMKKYEIPSNHLL